VKINKFNESSGKSLHDILSDTTIEDIFIELEDNGMRYEIMRSNKYGVGYFGVPLVDGDVIGIKIKQRKSFEISEYVINKDSPKYVPVVNNFRVVESDDLTDLYSLLLNLVKSIRKKVTYFGFDLYYNIDFRLGRLEIDIIIK
jgi:hypothetical protein